MQEEAMMQALFSVYLQASAAGACLILAVLLVRAFFRGMPAGFRCVLWLLVAVRLALPVLPTSPAGLLPAGSFGDRERWFPASGVTTEQNTGNGQTGQTPWQEMDGTALGALPEGSAAEGGVALSLPSAPAEETAARGFHPPSVLSALWLLGVCAMLIYMAASVFRISRTVRFAVPERRRRADGEVAAEDDADAVRVYRFDAIGTPFLLGAFRPKIYIPYNVRACDLPHVLRHELAHADRRDGLTKPLFFLILALHWFNPLVWLAFVLLNRDMEEACDNRVVGNYTPGERRAYADALLAVAVRRSGIAAFPVSFGEIPVRGRVEHVIAYQKPGRAGRLLSVALCLLLGVCFLTVRTEALEDAPVPAATDRDGTKETAASSMAEEAAETEAAASEEIDEAMDLAEAPGYAPVQSAHYRLMPDDEKFCYHIYDQNDNVIGGMVEYANALTAWDTGTGDRYLFSLYDDYLAYWVTPLDDELETDLREAMGERAIYRQPLSAYRITTDAATGLQWIVQEGGRDWEGHVLLRNGDDRAVYDALAEDYDDRFLEVFLERGVGYIYADLEIKGLCTRYDGGFVMLSSGQLQSVNLKEPEKGFLLALTTEEYDRLADWWTTHRGDLTDVAVWDTWVPVLDALEIDYDGALDTDGPQYKAAVGELERTWEDHGGFPPAWMDAAQADREIRNRMKRYDENGDLVVFGSVPKTTVTGEDEMERQEGSNVPERDE